MQEANSDQRGYKAINVAVTSLDESRARPCPGLRRSGLLDDGVDVAAM